MAENDKKDVPNVEVELLANGIRLDGVDYVRGDVIRLPKDHAERLQKWGSVGPKGSVEKAEEAEQERAEADARFQRHVLGLGTLDEVRDEPAQRAPGRPRKTEAE